MVREIFKDKNMNTCMDYLGMYFPLRFYFSLLFAILAIRLIYLLKYTLLLQ